MSGKIKLEHHTISPLVKWFRFAMSTQPYTSPDNLDIHRLVHIALAYSVVDSNPYVLLHISARGERKRRKIPMSTSGVRIVGAFDVDSTGITERSRRLCDSLTKRR